MLRPDAGHLFASTDFFNPSFLAKNNVAAMRGTLSRKESMQPIYSTGLIEVFSFDSTGLLTRRVKTFRRRGGRVDTSSVFFKYDDVNRLIWQNTRQNNLFDAYTYTYDSLGRMVGEAHHRGEDTSRTYQAFEPGEEFLINQEQFSYDSTTTRQITKSFLNNEGKPYKQVILDFDTLGNLVEQTTRFVLTGRRQTSTRTFDDLGRLVSITDFSNLGTRVEKRYDYQYDELGNVDEETLTINGKLTTTRQFVYDEVTLMLKAMLVKDEATIRIDILQFEYEFYP